MKIGYMRVSTDDQDLSLQRDALIKHGCDKIFEDKLSGKTMKRPGVEECLFSLQPGDSLVVWKLDRFGRSAGQVIILIEELAQKQVTFVSLTESIDTSSPFGEAMLNMLAVFAQLERKMISQRVKAGMAAAKKNGKVMGRKIKPHPRKAEVCALLQKQHSIRDVQKMTGIGRNTIWNISKQAAA